MIKTIDVICGEKVNKTTGDVFPIYATRDKDGKKLKVKFTKAVKNIETEPGAYSVTIDTENANISNDMYGETMWIIKVEKFEPKERVDNVSDRF